MPQKCLEAKTPKDSYSASLKFVDVFFFSPAMILQWQEGLLRIVDQSPATCSETFVVRRVQVRKNSYISVYLVVVGNLPIVRNGAKWTMNHGRYSG